MSERGYSVLCNGRCVARVGSVAGLFTATKRRSDGQPDIVSFAYVIEGSEWFAAWGAVPGVRALEIRDERNGRRFLLEVARVFDASHSGVVYEAEVITARET